MANGAGVLVGIGVVAGVKVAVGVTGVGDGVPVKGISVATVVDGNPSTMSGGVVVGTAEPTLKVVQALRIKRAIRTNNLLQNLFHRQKRLLRYLPI
jgi:hypothetical protein